MKGLRWGVVLKTALRIFGYTVAFGFVGFMFTPALMGAGVWLRVPLIGALVLAGCAALFYDGSYRGEKDCILSETLDKLERKGDYKATPAEAAKRYVPMKGVLAALIAALPLLLVALYVALTATPYEYMAQDLPAWLGAYTTRPEIGDALAYLSGARPAASLTDYARVVARFMLFPYVGLVGTMTDEMSLLFDRICPLLTLILPAAAAIGYLYGPVRRRKSAKAIEEAKRTPRKRLKKDRRQRGPAEKKQLV